MNENFYNLDILCENCDYVGQIEIPKGQKIDTFCCPKCGTESLKRDYNAHLKNRKPISYV